MTFHTEYNADGLLRLFYRVSRDEEFLFYLPKSASALEVNVIQEHCSSALAVFWYCFGVQFFCNIFYDGTNWVLFLNSLVSETLLFSKTIYVETTVAAEYGLHRVLNNSEP